MTPDEKLLFLNDPLGDFDQLIVTARERGASRLLILAGAPPVYRIGTELSPPLYPQSVHFSQTQALAESILTTQQKAELEIEGAVEIDYIADGQAVRINVFFGDGSHNFVVYL